MSISIKVGTPAEEAIEEKTAISGIARLKAKKTLTGNIMILDHADIDIVIMPKENKVVTFAKGNMSDLIYNTQDRLFKFLINKGIVLPESIRGGNVYGSLEAKVPEKSDYADVTQVTIYNIAKFLEEERDYMNVLKDVEEMDDERLTDPDEYDSTELGEVPHEQNKGTMRPGYPGYYYGLAGVYRYEE
jgi:hypothetical protein